MSDNSILLEAFSLAGYRSFGETPQRFEQLAKVNLLIGQNNSGKSNILRFLHEIYHKFQILHTNPKIEKLSSHFPTQPPLIIGHPFRELLFQDGSNISINDKNGEYYYSPNNDDSNTRIEAFIKAINEKAKLDGSFMAWIDIDQSTRKPTISTWKEACLRLPPNEINDICELPDPTSEKVSLTKSLAYLIEHILKPNTPKQFQIATIPAIRQLGKQGSMSDDFDGEGIIERLVKLQNPDVHSQHDKSKFEAINRFLQTVTDNNSARIEIPHERDTILVHMDGKTLPLQSLGTGIHEVIILASAATILENHIVCMEEPEIHLHPILQKKLVRYLTENTSNQYFISTHSAALMDTPNAEIYHVSLQNGQSVVERVTSDRQRSDICEDLGYHPSDLLQANCIIWVEGPSDRIYLNYWLYSLASELIEGIHYSIMFYGGRLASHLSGLDIDEQKDVEDFISLRRLNRRGVVLIDSDRSKKSDPLNETKRRLIDEFDKGPGHAWVTEGREIENYLPVDQVKVAIAATIPSATPYPATGKYDNLLSIKRQNGKKDQAPKNDIARYISTNWPDPNFDTYDLREQVVKLISFIHSSNPGTQLRVVDTKEA